MTDQPREPIRKSLLPCIPPPEWEFHSVLGAPHGCALLPVDTGPVVVRRRVIYGDWEPVRPDRWAPEPPSGALSAPRSVPQASDGPADGQDAHGGAEGPQGGPAELTAEEARALADQLGTDLYRAQDALEFVAECCTIADREQRPITTATVREWLKGAQCGRQLAADNPRLYNRVAAMFARPLPRPTSEVDPDGPDTVTDPAYLRDQYAAAIWERQNPGHHYADCEYRWQADAEADADAVLAVRDRHLEQLRGRLALADNELQQWAAAESADAAAGSYAGRAETAEAAIARVHDVCDQLRRASVLADGEPHTNRERGVIQAITRVLAALDKPQEQP